MGQKLHGTAKLSERIKQALKFFVNRRICPEPCHESARGLQYDGHHSFSLLCHAAPNAAVLFHISGMKPTLHRRTRFQDAKHQLPLVKHGNFSSKHGRPGCEPQQLRHARSSGRLPYTCFHTEKFTPVWPSTGPAALPPGSDGWLLQAKSFWHGLK